MWAGQGSRRKTRETETRAKVATQKPSDVGVCIHFIKETPSRQALTAPLNTCTNAAAH